MISVETVHPPFTIFIATHVLDVYMLNLSPFSHYLGLMYDPLCNHF